MKKIILKIIATIFTILCMFIIWFIYVTEFKVTDVSQHVNPINNYTILFRKLESLNGHLEKLMSK